MKKHLITWLVAGVVVFVVFLLLQPNVLDLFSGKAKASKNIVAVWQRYKADNQAALEYDKNGQEKTDWLKLANLIALIDCSQCPADFQVAWSKLVSASAEIGTQVNFQTAAIGTLEALHGGSSTLSRINEAVAHFQENMIECKRISAQYGVTFH